MLDLVLMMLMGPNMSKFVYLKMKTVIPIMVVLSVPILFMQVRGGLRWRFEVEVSRLDLYGHIPCN